MAKKNNNNLTLLKILLILSIFFINFISIPYNYTFLFNNIFYIIFILVITITLLVNRELLNAIIISSIGFILFLKSLKTNPKNIKNSEINKTRNLFSYNTHLYKTSFEETFIKNSNNNNFNENIPNKLDITIKKC
tara:strand:- start:711 stop:1115 length:405 start_codon:yes stop_codon:yes gene_type:complete